MVRFIPPIALLAALLTGCGSREDLRPAAGEPAPVAPAGAVAPPTPADLLEPSAQARPERSGEPLRRSEERQSDPFDLPPPG